MSRSPSTEPVVSVVMSVHNAGRFLRRAIESVLRQSLEDFDFVIVDDGSTDDSRAVIESFEDPRTRFYPQANQGVGAALNRGIEEARSQLIARMDADDVSMPDRLLHQVRFMNENVDVVLLGSSFVVIDEYDQQIDVHPGLTEDEDIRRAMFVRSPFPGGGVIMRRRAFWRAGAYDPSLPAAVDADLFYRLAAEGRVGNLPGTLYLWRFTQAGITHSRGIQQELVFRGVASAYWNQASPTPRKAKDLRTRMRNYQELGKSARVPLEWRFLENELDLGILMMRHGHALSPGITQLAAVLEADLLMVGIVLLRRSRRYLVRRFRLVRLLAKKAKSMLGGAKSSSVT